MINLQKSEAEVAAEKYIKLKAETGQARVELIEVMKKYDQTLIQLEDGTYVRLSVRSMPDIITLRFPIDKEESEPAE